MLERQQAAANRFLKGSSIDPFKHMPRLAEVSVNKGFKKRSILEEIIKKHSRGKLWLYLRCVFIVVFGV